MLEHVSPRDFLLASVRRNSGLVEAARARGRFSAICCNRYGEQRWAEEFDNLITNEGKNLAFDTVLTGSAYTATGPYLGLISSVSFSGVAATDVGTQINGTNGWTEAGGGNAPTYSGTRKTPTWSAAGGGAKAFAATVTFTMTSSGTVKGAFLLIGSGAVTTIDDAHGTLWSVGLFAADKNVDSTDVLNIGYSVSM